MSLDDDIWTFILTLHFSVEAPVVSFICDRHHLASENSDANQAEIEANLIRLNLHLKQHPTNKRANRCSSWEHSVIAVVDQSKEDERRRLNGAGNDRQPSGKLVALPISKSCCLQ